VIGIAGRSAGMSHTCLVICGQQTIESTDHLSLSVFTQCIVLPNCSLYKRQSPAGELALPL